MSVISVGTAKQFLRVFHALDDDLIQRLLNSAEDEALQFMNRDSLPVDDVCTDDEVSTDDQDEIRPSVVQGVLLLVQAQYDPGVADASRTAAETLLFPYRCGIGV